MGRNRNWLRRIEANGCHLRSKQESSACQPANLTREEVAGVQGLQKGGD
jgi:hypothetical protein